MSALKSKMAKFFDMKYMGDANHILKIKIQQDNSKKWLYLSQEEYSNKALQYFYMDRGKALMTPLPSYVKISKLGC